MGREEKVEGRQGEGREGIGREGRAWDSVSSGAYGDASVPVTDASLLFDWQFILTGRCSRYM